MFEDNGQSDLNAVIDLLNPPGQMGDLVRGRVMMEFHHHRFIPHLNPDDGGADTFIQGEIRLKIRL